MKDGDRMKKYEEKGRESGQAMVEWALVFPVFLLLILGIMDFSWVGYQRLMFESTFQMTAWDFTLKLQKPGGEVLSNTDILRGDLPPTYDTDFPDVVKINTDKYTLGEGIKKHMLQNSAGLLKEDKLTVESASANFETTSVTDTYLTGGSSVQIFSKELKVDLEGDLEYRVKLLTPVARTIFQSDEVVLEKKLVRERTERVVVERRVTVPSE